MKTGMILAGGNARRAGGREKYLFAYDGRPFLDRIIEAYNECVDEVVIVARDDAHCSRFREIAKDYDVTIVCDIRKGTGPIGGLHAGVEAVKGEYFFAAACDMPFVSSAVIKHLFSVSDGYDAVIPRWEEDMLVEPLHAVYKRDAVKKYLAVHPEPSLRGMVYALNSNFVPVSSLKAFDPELKTFTNVNRLDELENLNSKKN